MNTNIKAVIAAAAAGFSAGILIFTRILWVCCGRCKARNINSAGRGRQASAATDTAELSLITVDESASFDPSLQISMAELEEATKQFAPDLIVGDGGFGWVYKAQLSTGVTVAIKKLSPDALQGFREFRAEMETLCKLQHPNIVKMLGYCVSNTDRVLVYEFIEKGSLDLWLHNTSMESDNHVIWPGQAIEQFVPLSWAARVKIIQDVAGGLAYLHGLPEPIIHRDIKASNVLLDRNFNALIADFGLARWIDPLRTHLTTAVAGTMGYMPPEYRAGLNKATIKGDVYSFGILMFEVATGKDPNRPTNMAGGKGWKKYDIEVALIEWARRMLLREKEMEMIDPVITREGLDEAQVKEYFRIATLCTNEHNKKRASMTEVVGLLNRVLSS
ncbi:putative serine/threonine-protein kinase [Punica granatum]|uniref:Protein kinase domain-containing protein n=2 Tax=Punica granatum TaxID=22663 RepID=A0A218VUB8_PUNGR|nr:putative serine/threonine-protein kinase [Punica granatum]OWM63976.1 hypothetical protein CDL15_Pgr012017 [Punica granatum]PKI72030.1 hypothetical protein CRG98_007576 [Punica granatum]